MRFGTKTALLVFPIGIIGGLVIGFLLFGQAKLPTENLATIAIIIAIATWFGSGADYLGFLKEWYKETKEKEEKIRAKRDELRKAHYERDIKNRVLQKWLKINVSTSGKMAQLDEIQLSLYLPIKNSIIEADDHEEARAHIDSGYKKDNIYTVLNNIITLADAHNPEVATFMKELRETITEYVATNTLLSQFTSGMKTRYYFYHVVINHLYRKAQKEGITLAIKPYNEHPQLTTGEGDGQVAVGEEADLKKLKHYLESEQDQNIEKLARYHHDISKMEQLITSFREAVNAMIYEADRSGLKGRCRHDDVIDSTN